MMKAEESHRKEPRFAVCSIGEDLASHVVKIESMFGIGSPFLRHLLLVEGYARRS